MDVNDGKGLYDSDGLIDTLIVDCNNLEKHLVSGQYVQFCNTIVSMVQKLSNLKDGIKADRNCLTQIISEMKGCNDELVEQITGLPAGDSAPAIREDELP